MGLMVALKPIRSGDELLNPGDRFLVEDYKQVLLDGGYARKLTKKETQAILSDYVQYAKKLFEED